MRLLNPNQFHIYNAIMQWHVCMIYNNPDTQFSLNTLIWAPVSYCHMFQGLILLMCLVSSSEVLMLGKHKIQSVLANTSPSLKLCCFDGNNTIKVQEKRSLFRQKRTGNNIVDSSRHSFYFQVTKPTPVFRKRRTMVTKDSMGK